MDNMENEYIERAHDIWKRYQFHIIVFLGMVLAAIVGFTYQHSSFDQTRNDANDLLFNAVVAADEGNETAVFSSYEALVTYDDFPELKHLVSFILASVAVSSEHKDIARKALEQTAENSEDDGLQKLAALRLSELLAEDKEYDEAIRVLEKYEPSQGQFKIIFIERIGDMQFSQNDLKAAEETYSKIFELSEEGNESYQALINIKLGMLLSKQRKSKEIVSEDESDTKNTELKSDDQTTE